MVFSRKRVTAMYEAAFARRPTAEEMQAATEFVAAQAAEHRKPEKAWQPGELGKTQSS